MQTRSLMSFIIASNVTKPTRSVNGIVSTYLIIMCPLAGSLRTADISNSFILYVTHQHCATKLDKCNGKVYNESCKKELMMFFVTIMN